MWQWKSTILWGAPLWMMIASPAAGQTEKSKDSAEIQVWAIRATTQNEEISPELRDLADTLKKQFKYTGFKLERKATGKADVGKVYKTALISDYRAEVTPKKHDGERVTLQVRLYKGKDEKPKVSATVTIRVRRFQLIGGPSLGNGDALIVAVSAR